MSQNSPPQNRLPFSTQIASTAALDMVGPGLGDDLQESIGTALESKAIFREGSEPITIFRDAVAGAITDIEERASLLRRFLRDGPYEWNGDIPPELCDQRLTDDETSKVVNFIYSHVVNCFQGRLGELLAAGPCVQLLEELKDSGRVPSNARLHVGDSVLLAEGSGGQRRKAADMHIIATGEGDPPTAVVLGVVEVKSYACGVTRLRRQLALHVARLRNAAVMSIVDGIRGTMECLADCPAKVLTVGVNPATWKLPRSFSLVQQVGTTSLEIETPRPPRDHPCVERIGPEEWHIVLRWSQEALASAAYDMTFWYMEKLGESIFSESLPVAWSEMIPAEAGRNAAKMMLYYAMLRKLGPRVEQRAIALYNTYGFGYALGMNFRDPCGRRVMLWSEDLEEISRNGLTKSGCRIWR